MSTISLAYGKIPVNSGDVVRITDPDYLLWKDDLFVVTRVEANGTLTLEKTSGPAYPQVKVYIPPPRKSRG